MDTNKIELRDVTSDEVETVEGGSLRRPIGGSLAIVKPVQCWPDADAGGE